jgi:hypothetical protein
MMLKSEVRGAVSAEAPNPSPVKIVEMRQITPCLGALAHPKGLFTLGQGFFETALSERLNEGWKEELSKLLIFDGKLVVAHQATQ